MTTAERRERNLILRSLLRELDAHSEGERDHAERVAVLAVAMGERQGLDDRALLDLRYAALLHDVGKVRVDSQLLAKLGRLSDEELARLRLHAELSAHVLSEYGFLKRSLPAILSHHERWDGLGYPRGLKGNAIPLGGRIIAVAEAYDTLSFGTPWQRRMIAGPALAEVRSCAGTQFDPAVVEALDAIQPLVQPLGT